MSNKGIVINEMGILSRIDEMCAESLHPELYEKWEEVKAGLIDIRTNLQAAKPADALGSLPVVGISIDGKGHTRQLTYLDHATAELEKRDAEIAELTVDRDHWKALSHKEYWRQVNLLCEENATLRTQLAGALAESGEMREALKPFSDAFQITGIQPYLDIDDDFVEFFDKNTITPAGINMGDFRKAWEAMNGRSALARHTSTQESAGAAD